MENITEFLTNGTSIWLPRVAGVTLIVLIFYIATRVIKSAINKMTVRLNLDYHLSSLLSRSVSVVFFIIGFVTALGTLGINVSALLAGLGLTGFAVGFALKDTISNLLSGIMVLLYRPFNIGDSIKISGFEGKVLTVNLRYTELDCDTNKILIPNSKLFTDPIVVVNLKEKSE